MDGLELDDISGMVKEHGNKTGVGQDSGVILLVIIRADDKNFEILISE